MTADEKQKTMKRRKVLSRVGISTAALLGVSAVPTVGASKASKVDLREVERALAEKYGSKEAGVIVEIVSEWLSEVQQTSLGREEAGERAVAEIVENPNTPKATTDIRTYQEETQQLEDQTVQSPDVEVNDGPTLQPNAANISIEYGNTKWQWTNNTRVEASTTPGQDKMKALSNSAGIGSGYAWARIYGRYRPGSSGTRYVNCNYYRDGNVQSATGEIYLYIRPDGSGPIRKRVENIGGSRGSSTTRSTSFYMRGGRGHNVGIEVYTQSNGNLKPASIADFWNYESHVHVNSLSVY